MTPASYDLLCHSVKGNAIRISEAKARDTKVTPGDMYYVDKGTKVSIRSDEHYRVALHRDTDH